MIKRSILCLAMAALCAAGLSAQTITVWDFKYGEAQAGGAQAPMKQIDALFMQKNPGVMVNHVSQPGEPQYPYDGCYGIGSITLWLQVGATQAKYGKRVGCNLRGLQFAHDGDRFTQDEVGEDEFQALEDEVSTADTSDFD